MVLVCETVFLLSAGNFTQSSFENQFGKLGEKQKNACDTWNSSEFIHSNLTKFVLATLMVRGNTVPVH